jgi:NADH-quinone oxidoreductase subunit M
MLGALALTPEGLTGSMVHQVTQGISVAALFLLGGAIYDRASPWPAAGRAGSRPLATVLFVVAALAFACLPFSSGFVGARLIVRGVWPVGMVAGAVAVGGLLLSAGCLLWLVARTLRGTTGQLVPALAGVVRARDLAVALPIVAVAIWIGLHPAPLLWRLETAVARVVMRVSPQYAPQVADCLSAPPTPTVPDPSGLPAGMVLAAPCADESAADKRAPRKPQTPDR